MNILLPAICNPYIDPQVCRIALLGFVCPGVDAHQCCTVHHPEGIRIREARNVCFFKSMRIPAKMKEEKAKTKVNPLKQSKRDKSQGA